MQGPNSTSTKKRVYRRISREGLVVFLDGMASSTHQIGKDSEYVELGVLVRYLLILAVQQLAHHHV